VPPLVQDLSECTITRVHERLEESFEFVSREEVVSCDLCLFAASQREEPDFLWVFESVLFGRHSKPADSNGPLDPVLERKRPLVGDKIVPYWNSGTVLILRNHIWSSSASIQFRRVQQEPSLTTRRYLSVRNRRERTHRRSSRALWKGSVMITVSPAIASALAITADLFPGNRSLSDRRTLHRPRDRRHLPGTGILAGNSTFLETTLSYVSDLPRFQREKYVASRDWRSSSRLVSSPARPSTSSGSPPTPSSPRCSGGGCSAGDPRRDRHPDREGLYVRPRRLRHRVAVPNVDRERSAVHRRRRRDSARRRLTGGDS